MTRNDEVYLRHILDACERITSYLLDVDEKTFYETPLLQDGVIRQLVIIGEATKLVSVNLKAQHPGIPWQDMAGMRNKLIHAYFGVDLKTVWLTATLDIPPLQEKLQQILSDLV